MRLIYICEHCGSYIDEINVSEINEELLGFDTLTSDEREELINIDWSRQVGTVKVICDNCIQHVKIF